MPFAPPRACSGCGAPVTGKCSKCSKKKYQQQDAQRESSSIRGYDAAWKRIRVIAFIRDRWQCRDCNWEPDIVRDSRDAGVTPSTKSILDELRERHNRGERHLHGDHEIPIEQRPDLRLSLANITTRCSVCHSAKTMRESVNR